MFGTMESRSTPQHEASRLWAFWLVIAVLGVTVPLLSGAPWKKPGVSLALASTQQEKGDQTAVLAGGCFWGVDAVFKHVKGVVSVTSGYSGGSAKTAQYETVSTGTTGHAESVKITYDPSKISYNQLLQVFFFVAHDPTELNRQGPDTGTQYRSIIFYDNDEQKKIAQSYISEVNKSKAFTDPIVTEVVPLTDFYPAEDYHQNFFERNPDNPYIVYNDKPKLVELQKKFPSLYTP
jgi:peptide-methionine (S)-S-oxide reductase